MELLQQLWETIRHFNPDTVNALASKFGNWLYLILFGIIFAETGLVLIPFLPGDSLLFAVGAVTAHPDLPLSMPVVAALLFIAAVLGDAVNYGIGYYVGPAIFASERSRLLNKTHLNEAHEFYEKYGGKTIILARFIPIVRTFAPFVAGIGKMNYFKFALYNVVGGVAWVLICLLAGWALGRNEFVQKRFEVVIVAIVAISILPAVIEFLRNRPRSKPPSSQPPVEEPAVMG
jgi:membrane-associated protein